MGKHSKVIGGILLVAGTAVGAAMLALPVSTGMAGFVPSVFLLVIYAILMTFTALLTLEVNLWVGEGNNLISMAKMTLGRWGQVTSWLLYMFLLYSLTTAYIAGTGPLMLEAFKIMTGVTLPSWTGSIPLLAIFGFFVYKGARSVDIVNRVFMIMLIIAFFVLVVFLTPHVNVELLEHADWRYLLMGVSVVATSFGGCHIVIPSLVHYLDRDVKKLRLVVLIGSFIPLVVYIIWQFLTLGILPLAGEYGIWNGYQNGSNGAYLMAEFLQHSTLSLVAQFFSFFAIITSFLGVSLSLFDFLASGFKIKKTRAGRCLLYVMTFLPPLLITLVDPRAFLSALEYAGAFGVITLLALLPALMVWSGRYRLFLVEPTGFQAPGGKIALAMTIVLSVAIIVYELANKLGLINFMDFK